MFVAFAVELQMKLVDNQKITNMSALELNDLQKIQKQVDELRITQYLKLSKDEIDNELHLIEMELFKLMDKQCEGKKQPDTESKCNKHIVINRRELLLDFIKWLSKQDHSKHCITLVDEYDKIKQ